MDTCLPAPPLLATAIPDRPRLAFSTDTVWHTSLSVLPTLAYLSLSLSRYLVAPRASLDDPSPSLISPAPSLFLSPTFNPHDLSWFRSPPYSLSVGGDFLLLHTRTLMTAAQSI